MHYLFVSWFKTKSLTYIGNFYNVELPMVNITMRLVLTKPETGGRSNLCLNAYSCAVYERFSASVTKSWAAQVLGAPVIISNYIFRVCISVGQALVLFNVTLVPFLENFTTKSCSPTGGMIISGSSFLRWPQLAGEEICACSRRWLTYAFLLFTTVSFYAGAVNRIKTWIMQKTYMRTP